MKTAGRYTIAFKGLRNGRHEFHFQVDKALFEAFGNEEIRDAVCEATVEMTRMDAQMMLDVTIDGQVVVPCDRCLEDLSLPIHFEGRLPVQFSEEMQDEDGDVLWLLPGENEIDLTQYIYESVVLSLPYRRVHPEGECDPAMLERFRILSDEDAEMLNL